MKDHDPNGGDTAYPGQRIELRAPHECWSAFSNGSAALHTLGVIASLETEIESVRIGNLRQRIDGLPIDLGRLSRSRLHSEREFITPSLSRDLPISGRDFLTTLALGILRLCGRSEIGQSQALQRNPPAWLSITTDLLSRISWVSPTIFKKPGYNPF
jgi:hypothetical protein